MRIVLKSLRNFRKITRNTLKMLIIFLFFNINIAIIDILNEICITAPFTTDRTTKQG